MRGEESAVFGNKKEKTLVETIRRRGTRRNIIQDTLEDRSRVISRSPVRREGDTVRTSTGIVGVVDGIFNILNRREGRGEVLRDHPSEVPVVEVTVPLGIMSFGPYRLISFNDQVSHDAGIIGRVVRQTLPEGRETGTGRRENEFDVGDGVIIGVGDGGGTNRGRSVLGHFRVLQEIVGHRAQLVGGLTGEMGELLLEVLTDEGIKPFFTDVKGPREITEVGNIITLGLPLPGVVTFEIHRRLVKTVFELLQNFVRRRILVTQPGSGVGPMVDEELFKPRIIGFVFMNTFVMIGLVVPVGMKIETERDREMISDISVDGGYVVEVIVM